MSWALRKVRNNKLVLINQQNKPNYNYTEIPLTDEQAEKTLKYADWKLISNLHYYEYELRAGQKNFDKLLERFYELINEHKEDIVRLPNKKFITDVDGTGKLIRTKDNNTIYVAYRRNKKSGKISNITQHNIVCISDFDRDSFFKDCRDIYGMLPLGSVYKITPTLDSEKFKKWNKYIDDEYARQLKRYEDNKNIKK